ncbi:MAG TPA: site-specific integrase [Candidatus Polarisedimenticolia bacterium]|nr:site-specific integrase [Candidatus Polarisedimenticolia bacterium]
MVRRAKLYARINEGGSFSRLAVPFDRNGRALVLKPKRGKVVSYAVRVAGKFEHAGEDLDAAVTFLRQRQAQIGSGVAEVSNITPIDSPRSPHTGRLTIADAVSGFVTKLKEDVENEKKSEATLSMYRNAAETFRDHSGITFMDEITAGVLLSHEKWLRKNIVRRTGGHFENTLANRFRYLNVFLRANGIKMAKNVNADPNDAGLLDRRDVPKEKDITDEEKAHGIRTYNEEDIKALLSVANEDEADLIHFALKTGFREGEIAAAEWSDIDWTGKMRREMNDKPIPNIITGKKLASNWLPKGFRTKNKKSRKVEIPSLIARLKARQERAKKSGAQTTLIFPNGGGRFSTHLVEIIQDVAKRTEEEKDHKINGEVGLHRFRKTYGTYMLSVTDLPTVSLLLGHQDVQTTMRYLGVDRHKAAAGSKLAFSGIGD